jgi:hypothetical protein
VSAVIDMDDPLAAPPRDTPPQPSGDGSGSPEQAPPAEKRRGRKAGDVQLKADLKEIEEKLTQLLTLPSVPMDAAGDDWPARHTEDRAPAFAHAIAETARNNVQLRETLLRWMRMGDGAGLAVAGLAYALPTLIYYEILPIPHPVRAQIPVPRRAEARKPSIIDKMREEEERLASTRRARTTEDPPPAENEPAAAPFASGAPPAL